jgi:hypothetical protein
MRKTLIAVLTSTAAMAVLGLAAPAHAQSAYDYRWCAQYSGRGGGAMNCYFQTRAQCLATVSGVGGICQPNPWFDSARYGPRRIQRSYHRY